MTAPLTLSIQEAADLLGVSYWTVHRMIRDDTFPTTVIRCGNKARIARLPLEQLLGVTTALTTPASPSTGDPAVGVVNGAVDGKKALGEVPSTRPTATPRAVVSSAPTAIRRPKPASARAATARTPKKKPLAIDAATSASGSN